VTTTPRQILADAEATAATLALILDDLAAGPAPKLVHAMAYSTLGGGKRIRAALVLGAARLAREGAEDEGARRVAAAYECLHAYSLIHDDLPAMDDAETRRGKAACHLAFDEATAILAGDALQTLAFDLLADPRTHADGAVRAGLVRDLAQASGVAGMAGGQMLDLEAETRRFNLEETRAMQALKTGALIRAAAVSGGRVGGASPALLAALDTYATGLGLAFQIADDMLDRKADTSTLGKPVKRDDAAGKASYVTIMGMDGAAREAERLVTEAGDHLTKAIMKPTPWLDYMLELSRFIVRREN